MRDLYATPSTNRGTKPVETFNVLFMCTFNASRSIMAEAILNHLGNGRFCAMSAGDQAVGQIHPMALAVLREHGVPTTALKSKSWEMFFGLAAPRLDFIIIVCDDSHEEMVLPLAQQPIKAFWPTPNPAIRSGNEIEMRPAFEALYVSLESRIWRLLELPMRDLTRAQLWQQLMEIGEPYSVDRPTRQDTSTD
ncbi:MAG: arsenate reductase ArsC [Steroidobacteraceae bacterium]